MSVKATTTAADGRKGRSGMTMIEQFQSARDVSVPVVGIRTADQMATIKALVAAVKGEHPVVQWDAARGLTGADDELKPTGVVPGKGTKALKDAKIVSAETVDFVAAMLAVTLLPAGTVVCAHNAHRQLVSQEPGATAQPVQAVANLRDLLKKNFRMLVLLGPEIVPPPELYHDVVVLDHALPGPEELEKIVKALHVSAELPEPQPEALGKAVEAVRGLSAFAAEQVVAMSLTTKGLDQDAVWERKRVMIEQSGYMKVYRGTETFADVIGNSSVKEALRMRLGARQPVGVVCVIDEIDKVMANVEHDTSGVRMDQFRTLLTEMEDNEYEGVVLAGLPGGGKTLLAKTFGNEAGVPTVFLDFGGMESKYVGDSEAKVRAAMATLKAIGNGRAFFVATSNNATIMRPEMQRRFNAGWFWLDLMTGEERAAAWTYYLTKYDLPTQDLPDDTAWTGAEIRNCTRLAWNSRCSLVDAARFIVPVAQARIDEFNAARAYAHGRYLDANKPGKYDVTPILKDVVTKEMLRGINIPKEKVN